MGNIKLRDFLDVQSTVKTGLPKSTDCILNTVTAIYEERGEVEIKFDERYVAALTMVGDDLRVTKTLDGYEYVMDTTIIKIQIEPTKSMVLKVHSINRYTNLRKDERYSVNYAVTIQSFSEEDGIFGVVVNISVSGLAFVCRHNFIVGETVRLSILLPASTFTIDGEIVRVTDSTKGNEYGVKFLREDEDAIRDVKELIENIKEREDRLSRIVGYHIL
ncbi:MAG: PilZ domain-containing protein [Clostridia bacterium]|nr:PilZ domain-containing protein [Clostridia bacterium]